MRGKKTKKLKQQYHYRDKLVIYQIYTDAIFKLNPKR